LRDRPFRISRDRLFSSPSFHEAAFSPDPVMKRWLYILLSVVLAVGLCGCGNEKERGMNKDKDKPRAADK
jgi:hypothetical protein